VGTHFGGSIYSMTDPFYMLMLLHGLGKEYIVWDKSAAIRYKKPARSIVYAEFKITPEQIENIKQELIESQKTESEFVVEIKDKTGEVVAEVRKLLHVSKKI
jgi:hypothetical protein